MISLKGVSNKVTTLKQKLQDKHKYVKLGPEVDYKTKWRNLNELMGRKNQERGIHKIIDQNGDTLTEQRQIAEAFTSCFTNIDDPQSHNNI